MLKSLIHTLVNMVEQKYKKGDLIDGRYQVEEYLGSGSYGRSYLVYDRKEKRVAVLKALRLHKRLSKKGRDQFLRESDFLEQLQHPALPQLYNRGTYTGIPYFTMEYINGKTFEQLIFSEGKVFGERESFSIALELIEIIGFIHACNVVHRDIRIPNIMIEGDKIKIIDFGLAKELSETVKPLCPGTRSPFKEVSFRSDFYGLGHFLLFLLYSGYEVTDNHPMEKSWEEELKITPFAKKIIRRLLQLDEPYSIWHEVQKDFLKIAR
ncbi:serine/threonine protein kinase [Mesobacillus zeae]|uniref:Serine/threonine protein kinase n=1 Tax=Mesobacillus zeae TaxID=1917180 RepID=A0A398B9J6_9BACI|nr:protein kinase [Mesobacillus zeae]RID85508.1 serine/threonine protein kinase [Mesobacillus zeae]